MIINSLLMDNWRNFKSAKAEFKPRLNYLYGKNAQGKTNLLESVAYLSLPKSFRDAGNDELIGYGGGHFFIEGNISDAAGERVLSAGFDGKNRLYRVDGRKRPYFTAGIFNTLVFCAEDLNLIKGTPACRRKFLDRHMAQLRESDYQLMRKILRLFAQRGALLKAENLDYGLLEVISDQYINAAAELSLSRYACIERFKPYMREVHAFLTENAEQADIRYCPSGGEEFKAALAEKDINAARAALKKYADGLLKEEKARKTTLFGPSRDDFMVCINGFAARPFASQGQSRTAALALKMAALKQTERETGAYPALLLDDVASELDEDRRKKVFELFSYGSQIFITGTDKPDFKEIFSRDFSYGDAAVFLIEDGRIINSV